MKETNYMIERNYKNSKGLLNIKNKLNFNVINEYKILW